MKKRTVPKDANGNPIDTKETEKAVKQFQRRTTLELGLRNDDEDYTEQYNKIRNAIEPAGYHRSDLFRYSAQDSRNSIGYETVGSLLQHNSKRVRNQVYSFNS